MASLAVLTSLIASFVALTSSGVGSSLTRMRFVAVHFSPLITGQPYCILLLLIILHIGHGKCRVPIAWFPFACASISDTCPHQPLQFEIGGTSINGAMMLFLGFLFSSKGASRAKEAVHVSSALGSHLMHAGTVIAAIFHQVVQQERIPLHRLHCDSLLRALAEGWIAHMLRHTSQDLKALKPTERTSSVQMLP